MKSYSAILVCLLATVILYARQPTRQPHKHASKTPQAPVAAVQKNTKNLIRNGAFETGTGKTPDGWAPFDGLVQQWAPSGGNPGRCLVIDTSVSKRDKAENLKNPEEFSKHGRTPSKGLYDNVGADVGGWAFAFPVDVTDKDDYFILTVDVSAPAKSSEQMTPRILIRGFVPVTQAEIGTKRVWFHDHFSNGTGYEEVFGSKDQYRFAKAGDWHMVYRGTMVCRVTAPNTFTHFEFGFHLPKMQNFRPTRLLIKPYAYWPAGIYKFDNLTLRRATKDEVDTVNANRPSIKDIM